MRSYAEETTRDLVRVLLDLSPRLIASPPSSTLPSSTDLTAAVAAPPSTESVDARISTLRSALAQLGRGPTSADQLLALSSSAFPPFQGLGGGSLNDQTASVEVLLLAQLTLAAYGNILGRLMEEAGALRREDEYWANVEGDRWETSMFLVQTTPSRAIALVSTCVERLRAITTSSLHSEDTPSQSLLSINTFRHALPPSVLLTSIFPHLNGTPSPSSSSFAPTDNVPSSFSRGTRKLLLLTLSPLVLTRQEVRKKRTEIKAAQDALAGHIGELTLAQSDVPDLRNLLASPRKQLSAVDRAKTSLDSLRSATWETLRLLDRVVSDGSPTMLDAPPPIQADIALSIHHLLGANLTNHTSSFSDTLAAIRRPGFLTRSWPYLVTIPLALLFVSRTILASRDTIERLFVNAKETVRGFLTDWVIEPVLKILATVRHADDGGMALMGKESLRSDLDSLQRMVVDFARDEYKLPEAELAALAEQVRVGDLTSVLRVWEQDIKKPIRSAVTGSLIRSLLIQVQKLKVDVAIAVDGVEKMLQSQQLTFGFVGVAPSLIILLGVGQWVRGLLRRDGGKKNALDVRRKNWATMRHLDALLLPRPASSTPVSREQTQGFLLLELQSLRTYAQSRHFPTRDTQLQEQFLDDVRELEDSGAEAETDARRVLVERLWRWGTALGWSSII